MNRQSFFAFFAGFATAIGLRKAPDPFKGIQYTPTVDLVQKRMDEVARALGEAVDGLIRDDMAAMERRSRAAESILRSHANVDFRGGTMMQECFIYLEPSKMQPRGDGKNA